MPLGSLPKYRVGICRRKLGSASSYRVVGAASKGKEEELGRDVLGGGPRKHPERHVVCYREDTPVQAYRAYHDPDLTRNDAKDPTKELFRLLTKAGEVGVQGAREDEMGVIFRNRQVSRLTHERCQSNVAFHVSPGRRYDGV